MISTCFRPLLVLRSRGRWWTSSSTRSGGVWICASTLQRVLAFGARSVARRGAKCMTPSGTRVTGMSLQEQTVTVLTDEDEHIDYDFAELDELAHAYAITIHRSQGSEYPAVVIPLTTSSWMMLQRNLLYTGVTRAKQLIVLVGSRRALAQAVRTPGAGRRHTALTHRLQPVE